MYKRSFNTMPHVGVDGCKAGWIAVTRSGVGLEFCVFATIVDLAKAFLVAERILIDVPIGLPWRDVPIRPCDHLARSILGRLRKSSVFAVPCREALAVDSLDEAKRINMAHIGRSIGVQTWGISPKIAEVDVFLRADSNRSVNIREVHPEVCFWALAGRKPTMCSKATTEGREERVRILRYYEPHVSSFVSDALATTARKDVQASDVLDAAVAFVTAEARAGELSVLAGNPSRDLAGLPIEMLYLKI